MIRKHARLMQALRSENERGRIVPLLILRLPEFAEVAWRDGKRVASRLERSTAAAFREAATRIVRDRDRLFHEPGDDWFAVAMFAPSRERSNAVRIDARAALERIAAAISLRTGRRMETGWWPVSTLDEIDTIETTVERALERGARERERFEFLATVGHELRTPLTSIRGYIETLLDGDLDPEVLRRFLETTRRETLRLSRLVDGMLEFSLLDLGADPQPATTNLSQVVAAAFDTLQPMARERSMTFHQDVAPELAVQLDADACMHAVVNLVENAIKYGKDEGRVVVSAASEPPFVEVFVDDDGPGIAEALRESIFALRARGDAVEIPGSGIGLAIVKTIIDRAGGRVSIEQAPLGGARFRVSVRAAQAGEAELAAVLS